MLAERIRLTPGGPTLVATMRANGAYTCVVSGGFTAFTVKLAAAIGFDEQRANTLLTDADGRLTGEVAEPVLGREAKLETLRRTARALRLDPRRYACGRRRRQRPADDRGCRPRRRLPRQTGAAAEAAAARIDHGDLTALLYAQGYRREEFAEPEVAAGRGLLQIQRDETRLAIGRSRPDSTAIFLPCDLS